MRFLRKVEVSDREYKLIRRNGQTRTVEVVMLKLDLVDLDLRLLMVGMTIKLQNGLVLP